MTNKANKANKANQAHKAYKANQANNMPNWWRKPGYKNLLVYRLAIPIYDLTVVFCDRYINKRSRTHDQMIQAARSGKQNVSEGSLERSLKSYIKLVGVARGSFGELLEDYLDFLRQRNLPIWDKNDPRILKIRRMNQAYTPNEPNKAYKANMANQAYKANMANMPYQANKPNQAYQAYLKNPESFANLMVTLLNKENYLLDQFLRSLEEKFVEEGGYTENLARKRRNEIKSQDLRQRKKEDQWLEGTMLKKGLRKRQDGSYEKIG